MFRKMILAAALLCAPAAAAQDAFRPGAPPIDSNPPPHKVMCWTGVAYAACTPANPLPVMTTQRGGADSNQVQGTTPTGSAPIGNPLPGGCLATSPAAAATVAIGTTARVRCLPDGTQIVVDIDGSPVSVTPVTAAGVIFSTPTTGYAGVSFQTGTASNGGTWNFQGSNDSTDGVNGNWVSINAQQLNSSATSATQTPSAGFFIPAVMTYVRVNVTGTLTSAVGGIAVLRSLAPLPTVIQNQTINNNKMIYWNEIVNGAVAVGGTVQNSRDTGVGSGGEYRYVQFTCQLNSGPTASSTLSLSLQGSTDNTNWINYIAPIPVTAANTYIQQTIRMTFRYNRCRLFNDTGGTATTGTSLSTQFGE